MSPYPADDLRLLEGKPEAAWLWDAGRYRMVWANRAGLAFWGEDSLLDLIERRFDPGVESVRRIADLADTLTAGEWRREAFTFHPRGDEVSVEALCRAKPLDDGRTGVLVVRAGEAAEEDGATRGDLTGAALDALPIPVAVFDQHGSLAFANAACRDLTAGVHDTGAGILADWLGDGDRADALIGQGLGLGGASEVEPLETRFGRRLHRVTVRRFKAPVHGREALLFVFEDVEDRRRIERGRERRLADLEAYVEAAAAITFALDDRLRLRDMTPAASNLLAADASGLIGRDWDEACDALGIAIAADVAASIAAFRPVRGAPIELCLGDEISTAVLSAVPVRDDAGRNVAMRGAITVIGEVAPQSPREAQDQRADEPGRAAPPTKRPSGDDETFSAIGRAVAAHSKSAREVAEDAGNRRLAGPRIVAGLDHADDADAGDHAPRTVDQAALERIGDPALVHRDFTVLGANAAAAGLLGEAGAPADLVGANLLNLFPDERPRLFALQGQFDDGAVLQPGEIGMIPLLTRRSGAEPATLLTRIERIGFDGAPALLMRFEGVSDTHRTESAAHPADADTATEMAPVEADPAVAGIAANDAPARAPDVSTADRPSDDREARARENELRAIINSAADGIATLDADGRIKTFNVSAEAIFGRQAIEVAGDKLSSLLDEDSARTVEAYLQSVGEKNLSSLYREGREVTGLRADGGTIPLFLTIGPMNVEDGPRFCAVIRDITQWKQSETELRRARDQAEQASSKKSDFLARISHELRTPLNAIIGFSEVMSAEKFGPISNDRYKGYLTDIRASGEHLLSLINDLLDLSKIEAGKLELNFGSVEIGQLIQQCVQIMQPQANRERVIMRVSLPDELPPVVADERAMRQILLNLMSNAVKYTPPGGQVILSTVLDDDGSAQIRIRDTGAGMSPSELQRAMQPFRQIDVATRQSEVPGTGLGLPLTKALAEANRAEFRIESTPGAGTLVRIIFPPERVLAG